MTNNPTLTPPEEESSGEYVPEGFTPPQQQQSAQQPAYTQVPQSVPDLAEPPEPPVGLGESKITSEQEIAQLRRELAEIKQVMVYQAKQQQQMMQAGGAAKQGSMGGIDPQMMAAWAPVVQSVAPVLLDRFLRPQQVAMPVPAQGGAVAGLDSMQNLIIEMMTRAFVSNIEMNNSINNLIKERVTRSLADDIYKPEDERNRVVHAGGPKPDVDRYFHEH